MFVFEPLSAQQAKDAGSPASSGVAAKLLVEDEGTVKLDISVTDDSEAVVKAEAGDVKMEEAGADAEAKRDSSEACASTNSHDHVPGELPRPFLCQGFPCMSKLVPCIGCVCSSTTKTWKT